MVTSKTTAVLLNDPARQHDNDELVGRIARRIARSEHQRTRRRTQVYLQLCPPVWDGARCNRAVAIVHYVGSHPRTHESEVLFYPTLADAQAAHPKARILARLSRQGPVWHVPAAEVA